MPSNNNLPASPVDADAADADANVDLARAFQELSKYAFHPVSPLNQLSSAIATGILTTWHSATSCIAMSVWLTRESHAARGERTASAMETQLTSLERKIDDLLATVAGRDEPGSEGGKANTETDGNATAIDGHQSQKK